jgi:hypothetical protein
MYWEKDQAPGTARQRWIELTDWGGMLSPRGWRPDKGHLSRLRLNLRIYELTYDLGQQKGACSQRAVLPGPFSWD